MSIMGFDDSGIVPEPKATPSNTELRKAIERLILKNKPVTYVNTADLTKTIDELTALLIAEYKQLLNELPEKATTPTKAYGFGWNDYADQCRAIIQKHIEELE